MSEEAVVGESGPWQRVERWIRAVADTDFNVLITGEPGSGKSLVARRIHSTSTRSSGPFVGVAAGLREALPLADKGTLHVDEIADLSMEDQRVLLGFLQDREMGGSVHLENRRPDVRVVATSHRDLAALAQRGAFRADLVHRISAVRLHVPPLRAREEDIPLLAQHFAHEVALRMGRRPPVVPALTVAFLAAQTWPGNVRELRNVVERAVVLDPERGLEGLQLTGPNAAHAPELLGEMPDLHLRSFLGRFERQLVVEALRRARGVSKEAARLLGISPSNLGYFVRKHRIQYSAAAGLRPVRRG